MQNKKLIQEPGEIRKILHVLTCKSWTYKFLSWQSMSKFNLVKIQPVK